MKTLLTFAFLLAASTAAWAAPKDSKLVLASKELVTNSMKDPESVRFRNVRVFRGVAVCGEVNAKNSYGGYVGFKRFFVLAGATMSIEENASEFDNLSRNICVHKVVDPSTIKPAPYHEEWMDDQVQK